MNCSDLEDLPTALVSAAELQKDGSVTGGFWETDEALMSVCGVVSDTFKIRALIPNILLGCFWELLSCCWVG